MRKAYRLKHIPTGLYWTKKSYNRLSETGSVYISGNHAFSGLSPDRTIDVHAEDRVVHKHMDVFKRVGVLEEHPETKWDGLACKMIPTGKTYFTWHMTSKVSDFKKEYISMEPLDQKSESSVDDRQELIKKIADICWNHRVNPDIETFDEWMNLIQTELKQQ